MSDVKDWADFMRRIQEGSVEMLGLMAMPSEAQRAEIMRYWTLARNKDGSDEVVNIDACVDFMKSLDAKVEGTEPWRKKVGEFALRITPMSINQLHVLVLMLVDKVASLDKKHAEVTQDVNPYQEGTEAYREQSHANISKALSTLVKKPRSCNRHADCDAADEEVKKSGRKHPWGSPVTSAEHCHDDCCEECFGY